MKETLKITSVLTSVCVICAFFLSFVYNAASEKIELNAKKAINDAIITLAPSAVTINETAIGNSVIYKLLDKKNIFIGYAFIAQGQGYQGKIIILAVTDSAFKAIQGIEIIESVETPGLGAKINESSFKGQFKNLNSAEKFKCVQSASENHSQIQAITGATVSSRAVVNILNTRIEELKKLLNLNK